MKINIDQENLGTICICAIRYDLWRVDKNGYFIVYEPRKKDNEPPMVNMSLWEATK